LFKTTFTTTTTTAMRPTWPGMAELEACVARFMKVIIINLATRPDAENRLKKPKQSFVFEFSARNNFLVLVNYTSN
jgi:hypothetical protein